MYLRRFAFELVEAVRQPVRIKQQEVSLKHERGTRLEASQRLIHEEIFYLKL